MSTPVSSRPLSFVPFFAADGVLLLTALLIAWRTPDELSGGALLGVVLCAGLGAVLTVLPFVLNEVRERDAALAERQRELVDLVNSTTSTTSRWGAQWTAAATGLEDAAALATRNLAAAEGIPAVFQEKVDALSHLIEQAELSAQAREERAFGQLAALANRAEQAGTVATGMEDAAALITRNLATTERMPAILQEKVDAFSRLIEQAERGAQSREERTAGQLAALTSRVEQAGATMTELERTLAGFGRVETSLREQHTALAATLAEFPAAAARAQSAREDLDEQLASAPAQVEAQVARITTAAEARLTATTDALTVRLAGLEAALAALTEQLERVKALEIPAATAPSAAPVAVPVPAPASALAPAAVADAPVLASVTPAPAPAATLAPAPAPAAPDRAVEAPVVLPRKEATIMDPFYIPRDGYSALADAMDQDRS